jgi:hypothetical protein
MFVRVRHKAHRLQSPTFLRRKYSSFVAALHPSARCRNPAVIDVDVVVVVDVDVDAPADAPT